SGDLASWRPVGDALPRLAAWAAPGHTWAPAVLARPDAFVLYYTVRDRASGLQCLSRATSSLPTGPFTDSSSEPFVCQADRGGSIDPAPVVDDRGTPWLIWKSEGRADGEPTRVWVQALSDDGLSLAGSPTELLHTDQS